MKAIELYGDRAGSRGTFQFAGLAWLQTEKVVLMHGDVQSLAKPAEWRRFHRLATLAHRLKKPMVLWNLPVVREPSASLALASAIQQTELQLVNLPHPILTVFDGTIAWDAVELALGDGAVLTKPMHDEDAALPLRQHVKIAERADDIPAHLSALLCHLSEIPAEELMENRRETLRLLVKRPLINGKS
ncbi:hypothetical protein C6495_15705 [Candidatus Poribacteria bacterium]|nr:MAG: hypothetical protein C6495_15705 [Candidatus Poribacteria bacterium]